MPDSYRSALAEYIAREAKPIEKFGHQPRLYTLARLIGGDHDNNRDAYDDDVIYAAAWLHDLGVFTGHRPEDPDELARWDNVPYAIGKAPAILEQAGFPAAKIPAVLEAIRTHQPAAAPSSPEGIILRDADILEQLGAIGILRTVCKVGRDTRFLTFTSAVSSLRHALEILPAQLRLDRARSLAGPKVEALRLFLDSVEAEAYGALY